MIVSGSTTSCKVGFEASHGVLIKPLAPGAHVVPPIGPRRNLRGPYNCTPDGSRKPSPQVLRRVRLSSTGCQRTPTFGTAALVSLFSHSSYRPPAENSSERNPGMFHLGLKTGMSVSA